MTTSTIPGGTKVLNTSDGQPGTILNGFAGREDAWSEYEVETADGIETWKAGEIVRMDEIKTGD
jgi:hypothetical protein